MLNFNIRFILISFINFFLNNTCMYNFLLYGYSNIFNSYGNVKLPFNSNSLPLPENSLHNFKNFKKNHVSFSKYFFSTYLHLTINPLQFDGSVHHSYNTYCIYHSSSVVSFFNVKKLYQAWSLLILFIENLFYYNISVLAFSPPYFKSEVLSFNWKFITLYRQLWRFSTLFVHFINNIKTPSFENFLRLLRHNNVFVAIVIDIFFHKSTIDALKKNDIVTFGPVPITANLYTLSVSIPTSSNSVISNLFFLRLVFKLKMLNNRYIFDKKLGLWKFSRL